MTPETMMNRLMIINIFLHVYYTLILFPWIESSYSKNLNYIRCLRKQLLVGLIFFSWINFNESESQYYYKRIRESKYPDFVRDSQTQWCIDRPSCKGTPIINIATICCLGSRWPCSSGCDFTLLFYLSNCTRWIQMNAIFIILACFEEDVLWQRFCESFPKFLHNSQNVYNSTTLLFHFVLKLVIKRSAMGLLT